MVARREGEGEMDKVGEGRGEAQAPRDGVRRSQDGRHNTGSIGSIWGWCWRGQKVVTLVVSIAGVHTEALLHA